jgi:hypothetical protein
VREVEKRVDSMRTNKDKAEDLAKQKNRPVFTMDRPANGLPEDLRDHARLMCDIIAIAFQTDKTRVATLLLARDLSALYYPFLEVREGHHAASHNGTTHNGTSHNGTSHQVVTHTDAFTSTTPKFDFDRLGVRVPAVVVSPFIEPGTVDHTPYEHASIPASVTEQFIGPPAVHSPFEREKWATTFLHLLTRTEARDDNPFTETAAVRRMALEAPAPRPTGASPVSGLLRQQVSDVYFMLKRHHPLDAAKFNPDDVKTEEDAAVFLARGNAILNPPPAERPQPRRKTPVRPGKSAKRPARPKARKPGSASRARAKRRRS